MPAPKFIDRLRRARTDDTLDDREPELPAVPTPSPSATPTTPDKPRTSGRLTLSYTLDPETMLPEQR